MNSEHTLILVFLILLCIILVCILIFPKRGRCCNNYTENLNLSASRESPSTVFNASTNLSAPHYSGSIYSGATNLLPAYPGGFTTLSDPSAPMAVDVPFMRLHQNIPILPEDVDDPFSSVFGTVPLSSMQLKKAQSQNQVKIDGSNDRLSFEIGYTKKSIRLPWGIYTFQNLANKLTGMGGTYLSVVWNDQSKVFTFSLNAHSPTDAGIIGGWFGMNSVESNSNMNEILGIGSPLSGRGTWSKSGGVVG